jgi:hypothetical protein
MVAEAADKVVRYIDQAIVQNFKMPPHYILNAISQASIASVYIPLSI